MRTVREIDADLAAARQRVLQLEAERHDVRRAEVAAAVAKFDAGQPVAEIARDLAMTKGAVSGLLWRAGRSVSGREKVMASIRHHCAHLTP